jgi:hypothetical protein
MTVITQRQQPSQVVSTPRRRRKTRRSQRRKDSGSLVVSSLKASLIGGVCLLLLMLISLIPLQFLACLVIPGLLVAWLSTGMMAGIFAGDRIKNSQQGGKAGWMAGFWAGVYSGLIAMILAAVGVFMTSFGQGVADQLVPELQGFVSFINQSAPEGLAASFTALLSLFTPEVVALAARVFGALIVYGVIGSLVSGLFSSIGGMIYPKLSSS